MSLGMAGERPMPIGAFEIPDEADKAGAIESIEAHKDADEMA